MSGPDGGVRAALWRWIGRHAFRASLYGAFRYRRAILRGFGATLAPTSKVRRSVEIDRPWNLRVGERTAIGDGAAIRARAPVTIGDRCTISQLAILSTEAIAPRDRSTVRTGPITVEDDAWVAADVLVMPGSTVRAGTVVGARGMVDGELPAWKIAVGEPARALRDRHFATGGAA